MSRPVAIFDEFTDLDISNQAKYARRQLKLNPEQYRRRRQATQSRPEYKELRRKYMRDYYAKKLTAQLNIIGKEQDE